MSAVALNDLPRIGGERVPTLVEALDLCRGKIVNVEVKADAPRRRELVRAVARDLARGGAGVEVVLSSFDPRFVMAFAAVAPRVPRAMLVGYGTPGPVVALPLALRPIIVAAHVEERLLAPAAIARLLRLRVRVVAWTVNDEARAEALVRAGVRWVISDRPGSVARRIRA